MRRAVRFILRFEVAVLTILSLIATTQADEYATLSGRFVFDGEPPEPKAFKVDKDESICGKQRDESLLVHPKDRGIANVVVQLYLTAKEKPPVHTRLHDLRKQSVSVVSKRCRFEPHIQLVLTEQKLSLRSDDPVGHNPKINLLANQLNSRLIPGGGVITETYRNAEKLPVELSCSIHPWMRSYLIITDHPYVAASDESGNFSIPDLPPGKYTFRVWHERSRFIENVSREGHAKNWAKGRFTVKLTPGEFKLGEIKVPASEFPD
jgi:hypothetical protein